MIVATAGHIDHGKTSLVKLLTGIETDRLPEERKRGISIDLGFAHADLGNGVEISFIDVPGHERFIRNMLAGVIGIDAALLVIATDDGIMPQTREHLRILELLNVLQVAIVLSKIDKVSDSRVQEVQSNVKQELFGTNIATAAFFPISVRTGQGVHALKNWLRQHCAQNQSNLNSLYRFRMAIDRSFTISGSGTVITGTVQSGVVNIGDRLVISPVGTAVRVRGIQIHGALVDKAQTGQRCALNLSGADTAEAGRGNWVLDPNSHVPTNRLDVQIKVLKSEEKSLCHWSNLHIHIGTADIMARVILPAEGLIPPGETMIAQLLCDRSISAMHGDLFIIRDQSGSRTIGGGSVLDPHAPRRNRRANSRTAELTAYTRISHASVLNGLLDLCESGVDLSTFAQSMNLTEVGVTEVFKAVDMVILGKGKTVGINRTLADSLIVLTLKLLDQYHREHPKELGMTVDALYVLVSKGLDKNAFQAFVRDLANRQLLILSNDIVHLNEHVVSANPEDDRLWLEVRQSLIASGVHTPLISELSLTLKIKEQSLRDFLHRKSRTGEIRRITQDRFCLKETLVNLAVVVSDVSNRATDGFFSAAQYRDAIGTGRGLAIHYLEFFDRIGVTQRIGDRRSKGKGVI